MRTDDEQVFDRDWANAVWEYVTNAERREKNADARNAEIARAHREGWLRVATAVENGLGAIAAAVRSR